MAYFYSHQLLRFLEAEATDSAPGKHMANRALDDEFLLS